MTGVGLCFAIPETVLVGGSVGGSLSVSGSIGAGVFGAGTILLGAGALYGTYVFAKSWNSNLSTAIDGDNFDILLQEIVFIDETINQLLATS